MQDLDFSARELTVLRALMAEEPVPGRPLPSGTSSPAQRTRPVRPGRRQLRGHDRPDHGEGVARANRSRARHRSPPTWTIHQQHGGPFYLGYMHWRLYPHLAEGCGVVLGARGDALAIGFRNGTNHIVQYGFARESSTSPLASWRSSTWSARCSSGWRASARRPGLPATLTITERRILCDVAAGFSNARSPRTTPSRSAPSASTSRTPTGSSASPTGWPRSRGSAGATSPPSTCSERVERYA